MSPSACRLWQLDQAANLAQQRRCYTTTWDMIQIGLPRDRNELLRTAHPSSLKAVPYYLDRVASLRSGVPGLLARPHRNQSPLNRYAHNLAGTASCRGNTVNDRISAGRLPAFYLHFARADSGWIPPGSRYPSSVQDFCFWKGWRSTQIGNGNRGKTRGSSDIWACPGAVRYDSVLAWRHPQSFPIFRVPS